MCPAPKILLTSVFGPYGVDDEYGRKENINELFHNQVTREQGLFSLRFNHQSFGLYLMAENINARTTVLDFPSQRRFIRELKRGDYDYVGISFILVNFIKAQRMARLVRQLSPRSKIILGGHGASIPDIAERVDCDHLCRGEGVAFMRELLGQDPRLPISHPIMSTAFSKRLMGIPLPANGVVLMPGVGCPNGCRFCCTSHFFGGRYTPLLRTGREIFEVCCRAEAQRNATEFWLMDENFLKHRGRAEELLVELERHHKYYTFLLFSSAEAVREVGVDFLRRLGVTWLWIGLEGRDCQYEKNQGTDLVELVARLRAGGVTVLGSVILFTEQHDKRTIWQDVDFAIQSGSDFIQFMQLAPWPDTRLFQEYLAAGRLRQDIPYEEWHGQKQIWFSHPHFTLEESEQYTREAFMRVWDELGCSILRMIDTNLNGFLSTRGATEPRLAQRHAYYERTCRGFIPLLPVILRHAHNGKERDLARAVIARYEEAFGACGLWERTKINIAQALAGIELLRMRTVGNLRQPRTRITRYKARS